MFFIIISPKNNNNNMTLIVRMSRSHYQFNFHKTKEGNYSLAVLLVVTSLAGNLLAHVVEAEADVGGMGFSERSDGHIALVESPVNSGIVEGHGHIDLVESIVEWHSRGGIAGDNRSHRHSGLLESHLLLVDSGLLEGHLLIVDSGLLEGNLLIVDSRLLEGHLLIVDSGLLEGHLLIVDSGLLEGNLLLVDSRLLEGHLLIVDSWLAEDGGNSGSAEDKVGISLSLGLTLLDNMFGGAVLGDVLGEAEDLSEGSGLGSELVRAAVVGHHLGGCGHGGGSVVGDERGSNDRVPVDEVVLVDQRVPVDHWVLVEGRVLVHHGVVVDLRVVPGALGHGRPGEVEARVQAGRVEKGWVGFRFGQGHCGQSEN